MQEVKTAVYLYADDISVKQTKNVQYVGFTFAKHNSKWKLQ